MEHTKGDMIITFEKEKQYFEYFKANGATLVRVAEIIMPHRTDSQDDAKRLVKRWNAFEEGGLVDTLLPCSMSAPFERNGNAYTSKNRV